MRRHAALAVAALVLAGGLAGCLGDEDGSTGGETSADGQQHGASAGPSLIAPVNVSTRWPGAEPVVAVTEDGTIFVEGVGSTEDSESQSGQVNKVFRSTDGGQSWEDVTPPALGEEASLDGFVAAGNGGSVYVANAGGGQLSLWRSADAGDSWDPSGEIPYPTPMHRMWIVPRGESTVHLSVDKLSLAPPFEHWYHRSTDRGQSWRPPTLVNAETPMSGFGSDLAVGPDGTLYLTRLTLETDEQGNLQWDRGDWTLLRSTDDGLTWTAHSMFRLNTTLASSWQALTVDPSGTLYMVWAQEEPSEQRAMIHLAVSADQGESWSTPQAIAPSEGAATLPWAQARASGELGLVWYATDEAGLPLELDTRWHVDYALVTDADAGDPQVHRARVTSWPVHEGNICYKGPFCEEDEDRALLDYPWVTFGPEGRAHLAFASTQWDEPSAFPVYAAEATPFTVGDPGDPQPAGEAADPHRAAARPPGLPPGSG